MQGYMQTYSKWTQIRFCTVQEILGTLSAQLVVPEEMDRNILNG